MSKLFARMLVITPRRKVASVASYTFTDGYNGDVFTAFDMQMSSSWPNNNGGGHANFQFETGQRGCLKFNLSSIPSGATCTSAKLYVYHSYATGDGPSITVNIYSIAAANADWVAGTKNIALAAAGESCWNARHADGSGGVTTAWAGSAGCNTAGTDYESTAIGSFAFNGADAIGTEYAIDLTPARVQGWFGAVNTNYGVIWIPSANSGHVAQSSNATTAYRPKLVVTYTV